MNEDRYAMKILFLSHEASRTGAPLLLLNFLKWKKQKYPEVPFEILLLRGGELIEEFAAMGPVHQLNKWPASSAHLINKIKRRFVKEDHQSKLFDQLAKNNFSIIYANTVATCNAALEISSRCVVKPIIILHVHELRATINQVAPDLHQLISHFNLVIAASEAVKRNLIENHQVPENKIRKVNEFVLLQALGFADQHKSRELETIMPPGKFVVGGSGNVHWRKGADLYIQVALDVFKQVPDFNGIFVWVGFVSEHERAIQDEDVRKAGLTGKVVFVGPLNPPYSCFEKFSIFLMTSREDPFPVVSLELGALGKPIICFKDAGGTEEMIDSGGGKIVPYLDTAAMAAEVLMYYRNPEKLRSDGARNESVFTQYDIEKIAPQLFSVISECKQ